MKGAATPGLTAANSTARSPITPRRIRINPESASHLHRPRHRLYGKGRLWKRPRRYLTGRSGSSLRMHRPTTIAARCARKRRSRPRDGGSQPGSRLNPKLRQSLFQSRPRVARKGRQRKGVDDFSEAIRLNPQLVRAYTYRGPTHEAKGDIERARGDFKAAAESGTLQLFRQEGAGNRACPALSCPRHAGTTASPYAAAAHRRRRRPSADDPGKRIALVIGNGAYQNASPLPNPVNDARVVGKTCAISVSRCPRASTSTNTAMMRLIRDFLRTAPAAQLALVFYAGHGLQVDGRNYLVPIDAKLTTKQRSQFRDHRCRHHSQRSQ